MAARRLIAVLIVLMLVSTFAAALAPQRQGSEEGTEDTTTTTAAPPPSGELVEAVIPARPERPQVVAAEPGDQLRLVVRVADPQPVSIAQLGLTSFATPGDPARFDILVRGKQPATIEAGEGKRRETVGRIEVG